MAPTKLTGAMRANSAAKMPKQLSVGPSANKMWKQEVNRTNSAQSAGSPLHSELKKQSFAKHSRLVSQGRSSP